MTGFQSMFMPRPVLSRGRPATPVVPAARVGRVVPEPGLEPASVPVLGPFTDPPKPVRPEPPPAVYSKARADWIVARVCAAHGIPVEVVLGERRTHLVVAARHAVIAALVEGMPKWGIARIAAHLGRDHTTVLHALKRANIVHGRPCRRRVIPEETLQDIRARRLAGETIDHISDAVGVNATYVSKYLRAVGITAKLPGRGAKGHYLPRFHPDRGPE